MNSINRDVSVRPFQFKLVNIAREVQKDTTINLLNDTIKLRKISENVYKVPRLIDVYA